MADCSNVEIRELLPERAAGALSAADIARVDAHLADCALCTAELALIQVARRTLRVAPAIDLSRVAASVVRATATPSRPQLVTSSGATGAVRPAARLRWVGWKAAAAIAIAAAGIGSFAVWHSTGDATRAPDAATVAIANPEAAATATSPTVLPGASPSQPSAAAPTLVATAVSTDQAAQPAELGVAGGLSDLSRDDLQALLGDIGSSATTPADASFDEPAAIVPEVGAVTGWESL